MKNDRIDKRSLGEAIFVYALTISEIANKDLKKSTPL
jgi:hypothetical protein